MVLFFFFFQAEDGIRDHCVTGVQTCALPIYRVIKALLDSRRYAIGARAEGEPAKKARLAKAVKTAKNARAGASPLPPLAPGGELEAWEIAGAHCSANERRADEAS